MRDEHEIRDAVKVLLQLQRHAMLTGDKTTLTTVTLAIGSLTWAMGERNPSSLKFGEFFTMAQAINNPKGKR